MCDPILMLDSQWVLESNNLTYIEQVECSARYLTCFRVSMSHLIMSRSRSIFIPSTRPCSRSVFKYKCFNSDVSKWDIAQGNLSISVCFFPPIGFNFMQPCMVSGVTIQTFRRSSVFNTCLAGLKAAHVRCQVGRRWTANMWLRFHKYSSFH